MKLLLSPFLVLSLFIVSLGQTTGLPKLRKGESYRTVRSKMLKAGWKPAPTAEADKCSAGDERCQGRPEMESCSGTGLAYCAFRWKRKGKVVVITTVGENARYSAYRFER